MKGGRFYLRLNFLSIAGIFLLFVLGGLVRATGSGMGCPDWPKCYGEYLPPLDESALPSDYKEIYLQERLQKTQRFVSLLERLGLDKKAEEIRSAEQLSESHAFNVAKAYIEYINRLWGALTGLIVLLCLISSLAFFNTKVFLYTILGFVSVMINALIGAVVVNANLLGGIVTIHFLAAFAAISFFLLARKAHKNEPINASTTRQKMLALVLMILLITQIVLGTQVREVYDLLQAAGQTLDSSSIHLLGGAFNFHRTLAVISLLIAFAQMRHFKRDNLLFYSKLLFWICLAQIVFGSMIIMTDLSAISKAFHISFGAAIFIIQFYICTRLFGASKIAVQRENN